MRSALLLLRAATTRLRRIPGAVLLLEPLRRWYCRAARSMVVPDFDGTLLEVRLDEHMGSHIFWYGSYSRELLLALNEILRPGMVVIDVGANIGEVSLYAAKRVAPDGRVFAFEPVPGLAVQLRQNLARNQLTGVQVVESALSDRAGSAVLYTTSARFEDGAVHAGLATLYDQTTRQTPIGTLPVTTLDQFLGTEAGGPVHLIKIDVEGAELPVLRGAAEALRRWRPWLVIEVQRDTSEAAGYQAADILRYLQEFGYQFARIGRRGRLESVTADSLGEFQNVLCVPQGQRIRPN